MKIFVTVAFRGYYPVGTAAVIIARDEDEAIAVLRRELEIRGLEKQNWPKIRESLQEISPDVDKPEAIILRDGDY